MSHISVMNSIGYVNNTLDGNESEAIEIHAAECDACCLRIRAAFYVSEHFEDIFATWSAASHRRAVEELGLFERLISGHESACTPAGSGRAEVLEGFREFVEVKVRILLGLAARVAMVAAELLPPQCSFQLAPLFEGVGSHEHQEQISACVKESSVWLSKGQEQSALQALEPARLLNARLIQAVTSEILREGRKELEISADSRRNEVVVKYYPRRNVNTPRFAVLVPLTPGERHRVAVFRAAFGTDYLLACFRDVKAGQCELAIVR